MNHSEQELCACAMFLLESLNAVVVLWHYTALDRLLWMTPILPIVVLFVRAVPTLLTAAGLHWLVKVCIAVPNVWVNKPFG